MAELQGRPVEVPGIMVSAPWRSSGKTTVSMGLIRAACRRQLALQPFKKGPDYIDPLWLGAAGKLPCYNLDPYIQSTDEVIDTYSSNVSGNSLALVEGTMGLHDGLASDGTDSNAAIAALLGLSVVLVVDCRGMHRTIAALINGIQHFDPDVPFAGVILNRIRSDRHRQKIATAMADHSDMRVLGCLPDSSEIEVIERELGLTPAPDCDHADTSIDAVADALEQHCDLHLLFDHCVPQPAKASNAQLVSSAVAYPQPCRIGLCRDAAFHFTYQDDRDELHRRGVEVVELSPLADEFPDNLHGLIIGGGFPERHAKTLAANSRFRRRLKTAIANGLVVHAECAGLMYLCRSIHDGAVRYPMVSAIEADVTLQKKPVGRGYVRLAEQVGGASQVSLPAHEFHHSKITFDNPPEYQYSVKRGYGVDGEHDGVRFANVIASYAHFRHTRRTPWIDWFLARVTAAEAASRAGVDQHANQGRVYNG